jgi:hypothetical protein
MNMKACLIFILLHSAALNVHAEEKITMDSLQVIGNKEMPNILYILPWQTAQLPTMVELPLSGLIQDALQPVDRESILRRKYYQEVVLSAESSRAEQVESN